MSRKPKSQASSARAASALTGGSAFGSAFQTNSSPLSYIAEAPDLSHISEPSVVVAFKSLSKKDSTTKTKALEDLHDYCSSVADVEQAILTAWADVYPRTSIDNSRRVRQLAHNLQGTLTAASGKRIAPLLPKLVGSWLAATFDADRTVSRSAQDALEKSFPSSKKIQTLWQVYRDSLIDYVVDAITIQTKFTLSDERTTSADDAEAKYVRVVGTAMSVLATLLENSVHDDRISDLLTGTKVWGFVYYDDPLLRKASSSIAISASNDHSDEIDWSNVSTCFLAKGLQSSQIGSCKLFTEAIIVLTKQRPRLWTSDYTGKTNVTKRLVQFLQQGSQQGPESVWSNIMVMLTLIPGEVWAGDDRANGAKSLAHALRTGVTQPAERLNASVAWNTYVEICLWLLKDLGITGDQFASQYLTPIVAQYVTTREDQQWTVRKGADKLCQKILLSLSGLQSFKALEDVWRALSDQTIIAMKTSQPETSKDFAKSQDEVSKQMQRLYGLRESIWHSVQSEASVVSLLEGCQTELLEAAIQLLRSRNGKPYCAAYALRLVVSQPDFDINDMVLLRFLQDDLNGLLGSPSGEILLLLAVRYGQTEPIDYLLKVRASYGHKLLCHVLRSIQAESIPSEMQARIAARATTLENADDQELVLSILSNKDLELLHVDMANLILECLSLDASLENQHGGMACLESYLLANRRGLGVLNEHRSELLSRLLLLSETDSDVARKSAMVIQRIKDSSNSTYSSEIIIQKQLDGDGTPLAVFTLLDLAQDVLKQDQANINKIMPSETQWKAALKPHMTTIRPTSLAITSQLQGLVYTLSSGDKSHADISRDADDFSMAFRLAFYTTKQTSTADLLLKIDQDVLRTAQRYLPVAIQLINEKLTVESANEIWLHSTPEIQQEAADVLSEGYKLIQAWLEEEDFLDCWRPRAHEFMDQSPSTYCEALAWTSIIGRLVDRRGPAALLDEYDQELRDAHRSEHLVRTAALISVLHEHLSLSPSGKRLGNELVASATKPRPDLAPLLLLNILLDGHAEAIETLPAQRLVFLFKNLVNSWDQAESDGFVPECLKLLAVVVPLVADLYGEYWEQMLSKLVQVWNTDIDLPLLSASLRLYARISILARSEEVNEDLNDAWQKLRPDLDTGLFHCLQLFENLTLEVDQPRDITAEQLRRQLTTIDLRVESNMFKLLGHGVEAVQTAAFEMLHRAIPQEQEKLSLDLILEHNEQHLSTDLMEILDDSSRPRQYLLAWTLLFDHFPTASFKLRESYALDVKNRGQLADLLSYICTVVRITDSKPVDASKFDIETFRIGETESPEREILWLAIHAYYLCLLYLPSLTKEWFIAQKNRVKPPLENWTLKYISPAIIAASLATVRDWAANQSTDGNQLLEVKSNLKGSEMVASIAIDPENPPISIAIALPGSYPLESPLVTSRTRVGVSEKNWHSWLRTFQIIIFSSGSIIEGLIAFRRNVQGALQGQTECAICYSIIGTDMQTPNKKCATCKNTFHGSCLFRWFKSSNSSSCPLCRNNFNYA